MRIAPLSFKEFDASVAIGKAPAASATGGIKPLLPGGRRREAAPPPLPPTFSEEQFKAAERDSYKKGFLEGTEEGRKQAENEQAATERKLAENVEKFVHCIAPLLTDYRQMVTQLRTDMPKVALAIAKKAAGNALQQNAYAAVEEVAVRCAETMISEPKITITVHESMAESLEKKLKALVDRLQVATDIVVLRDANITPADCRIEWKYGAMERHTGQLWEQIERATETLSAGEKHNADAHLQKLETQVNPNENPKKE